MKYVKSRLFLQVIVLAGVLHIGQLRLNAQTVVDSGRVPLRIDWDAALKAQDLDRARSSAVLQSLRVDKIKLDSIRLPVLVPSFDAIRHSGQLTGQGTAYAASYELPAAQLSVMGSAYALAVNPDSAIAPTLRQDTTSEGPLFEVSEDGADLSFFRYGAAYVMRISCSNADDPRCAQDIFLRSVANNLIVIGGAPR